MRICYLLLVHQRLEQAERLIRRLTGPGVGVIIHLDASVDARRTQAFQQALRPLRPLYAPSMRAHWGSYRQALAIVRCLQTAAQAEPYDRYCLLSGQDYPIASNRAIGEFFAQHPALEYVEAQLQDLADAKAPGWSAYYRFRRYHLWLGQRRRTLPLLRKGPAPLPIYHGSTWWALTRAAMLYVVEQFEANRALRRYLETGFLVDEVYVPTLLMSSPLAARVTGGNLTYARWTPTSGPHPTVLRLEDLGALQSCGKLFARKFDMSIDANILDALDRIHAKAHAA